MKKFFKKFKKSVKHESERGARKTMIEELLIDMNRNRFSVYKINFFRGIFFGLGSVLGGTLVLAVLVWALNLTGQLIPGVGGFVSDVVDVVQGASGQ
jgi:hypothetical protein